MALTFKGGFHIPDHKTLTCDKPIRALDGDSVHIFPLKQHIGAPLEAKVAKGDSVKVGQVLADTDAFVATPVHSSISGTVTDIRPYLHPSGEKVMSIFIENDFKYEKCDNIKPFDYTKMTVEQMLAVVRNSGIVGMGGAGFPTHVKLAPPPDKKCDTLLVNAAECEPYITADHRRMLEMPDDIIDGIHIIMKILGLDKAYIGIETNKKDAIDVMREKAAKCGDIKVCPLKPKYPQGSEKQLIYAITKRCVPSGKLPADVGAVVVNIDTAAQIAVTFRTGMPLIKRIVTVSGDCIAEPANFEVYTGVTFDYLIKNAGGLTADVKKIVMGGPMMGIAQFSLDAPVVKTTSSILALSDEGGNYDSYSPCIRCGKCVDRCPMRLSPMYLSQYALEGNLEMAEKYRILDCMECGMCSYICPGKQNQLHNIRIAKQKILENRRKKK